VAAAAAAAATTAAGSHKRLWAKAVSLQEQHRGSRSSELSAAQDSRNQAAQQAVTGAARDDRAAGTAASWATSLENVHMFLFLLLA
jgi:hypothetical protein